MTQEDLAPDDVMILDTWDQVELQLQGGGLTFGVRVIQKTYGTQGLCYGSQTHLVVLFCPKQHINTLEKETLHTTKYQFKIQI